MFQYYLQLLSEAFFFLRRIGWDMIGSIYWSSVKYPLFLSKFMKLDSSWQFFFICSNIKFYEHLWGGSWVVHADRQMNRHDEANSRLFAILWMHLKNKWWVQGLHIYMHEIGRCYKLKPCLWALYVCVWWPYVHHCQGLEKEVRVVVSVVLY